MTVKLADNYKGKVGQPQLSAAVVPVPVHMNAGYQQTGAGAPIGYTYPQTYPTASYASPTGVAAPYSAQPQYSQYSSYSQFAAKKETPPPQTAYGGYPYYMPKQ